jgi:hypothetical protein
MWKGDKGHTYVPPIPSPTVKRGIWNTFSFYLSSLEKESTPHRIPVPPKLSNQKEIAFL